MKEFFKKYSHAWTLLYILVYFPWFMWLEQRNVHYTMIYTAFDTQIPFCEYFAIPYFLWFLYVPAITIFILFKSKKENFYKFSATLFIGMTICLIIYTLWPNEQPLRIYFDVDKNIFTKMVSALYKTDTSTNVFPSIHVYNSLVCHFALCKTPIIKDKKLIKSLSLVLMLFICLSTLFLKQHSILDALASLVLFCMMITTIYHYVLVKPNELLKKPITHYEDSSSHSSR